MLQGEKVIRRDNSELIALYSKIVEKLNLTYRDSQLKMILDVYSTFFDKPIINFSEAPTGCVDKDTEFLTPEGWKKINEYTKGDQVAQYHSNGSTSFVLPITYHKIPETYLYEFKTKYGLHQCLSLEHTVLYKDKYTMRDNTILFKDLKNKHESTKYGFEGNFITTFTPNITTKFHLTNEELQLMVAVIADGHFPNKTPYCCININKERKKKRLRLLLYNTNIEYREKKKDNGYSKFYFNAPIRTQVYGKDFYKCSTEQLRIINAEVILWEGDQKNRFFTMKKESADFIQYVFTSCGYRATIQTFDRTKEKGKHHIEYSVDKTRTLISMASSTNPVKINKIKTIDGFKYCFTVPTGYLVLRKNDCIFITGNSGKSLAYLIPAIVFTQDNPQEKVIISTKTLNLQEQLLTIDIPKILEFFKNAMEPLPYVTVLKGRSNYICGWRLFIKNKKRFEDELETLERKIKAGILTERSEFLDLGYKYQEWKMVETEDSKDCLRGGCPYNKTDKCCSYMAKQDAKSANIIIVNHYLLFTDLWGRINGANEPTIPITEYTNVIMDEAHLLEDIITKTFTSEFNNENIYALINTVAMQYAISDTAIEENLRDASDNLAKYVKTLPTDELPVTDELTYHIKILADKLQEYITFLADIIEIGVDYETKIKLTSTLSRLGDMIGLLLKVIKRDNDKFVVHKENHIIKVTLIDYKSILESVFFNENLSLTMTSATLSYKFFSNPNLFEYPMKSLFIDKLKAPPKLVGNIYPKIFNKDKVTFSTPSSIKDYRTKEYEVQLAFLTKKMIELNKGSALILFTSLQRMVNIYEAIHKDIPYKIFMPTKDTSKLNLINKFKKDVSSVLFGSYSFWEGIDVPGESLTLIIIDKLPFEIPSIVSKALNNQFGGFNYQCFKTTLKLRQGIGRLIRSETDCGQIIICDNRLSNTHWGKQMFNNLN